MRIECRDVGRGNGVGTEVSRVIVLLTKKRV